MHPDLILIRLMDAHRGAEIQPIWLDEPRALIYSIEHLSEQQDHDAAW